MKFPNPFKDFKYHTSIETMPILNWFRVQETNDLTWILYKKRECSKPELDVLFKALEGMTDQYIDTFGISDNYREILETKRDIAVNKASVALGDKTHSVFVTILEDKLKTLASSTEKNDWMRAKVHAEKYMGRAINTRDTTVHEFYTILQELKKEVEASRR